MGLNSATNGLFNTSMYRVFGQAGSKTVSGHVGGISCIRFTSDDAHVVSIGKGDRTVYVWTVEQG